VDDPGTNEGQRFPGAHRLLNTPAARQRGSGGDHERPPGRPREHGRQAARSKRDRPERAK